MTHSLIALAMVHCCNRHFNEIDFQTFLPHGKKICQNQMLVQFFPSTKHLENMGNIKCGFVVVLSLLTFLFQQLFEGNTESKKLCR